MLKVNFRKVVEEAWKQLAEVTKYCRFMTQDSSPYNLMLATELDMRLFVVDFPTGEADTVPVYLGRWTLAVCRRILPLPDCTS